jgi:hypothetical protein
VLFFILCEIFYFEQARSGLSGGSSRFESHAVIATANHRFVWAITIIISILRWWWVQQKRGLCPVIWIEVIRDA